uniref:Uncharacterized protein n=4 Tax=Oryza TaxID=4527 RepID=A0A0D3FEV7_9ORYZ
MVLYTSCGFTAAYEKPTPTGLSRNSSFTSGGWPGSAAILSASLEPSPAARARHDCTEKTIATESHNHNALPIDNEIKPGPNSPDNQKPRP